MAIRRMTLADVARAGRRIGAGARTAVEQVLDAGIRVVQQAFPRRISIPIPRPLTRDRPGRRRLDNR